MPLIVDTYNVLHVAGVLPAELAGIDTSDLIDLIVDSRFAVQPVALVCDGRARAEAPEGDFGPVRVIYAGPGVSADDVIESMVDRSSAPRELMVISTDRAVAQHARRRGCRVMPSEEFLRRIAHDVLKRRRRISRPARKPHVPLSPGEVDAWMRLFGLADRDDPLAGDLNDLPRESERPDGRPGEHRSRERDR